MGAITNSENPDEIAYYTAFHPGLKVITLEHSLKHKIKHNNWLLVDTCLQAANHCALF